MRAVGIRDLKDHLSQHLADVRRGEVILVSDRGIVVAEPQPERASPAKSRCAGRGTFFAYGCSLRTRFTSAIETVP